MVAKTADLDVIDVMDGSAGEGNQIMKLRLRCRFGLKTDGRKHGYDELDTYKVDNEFKEFSA